MKTYNLTLKDKIYLFFHEDRVKRMTYLFPKVKKHQLNWFNEKGCKKPLEFDRYISNYVDCLIFEYDTRRW